MEPTSNPTPESSPSEPAAPQANDPAPGTYAEPMPQPQQQQTEPQPSEPQSTTAPTEPVEPQEPTEPIPERVVPKPSEYELPEGLPDNIRIFAHEHGFTQDQLNATLDQFSGYIHGMHQAEAQAMRQLGEAHVKNWGPEAKTNMALAKAAMNWLDTQIEGFSNYINGSMAGNNPHVIQALYLVGKSMQEGGYIKSAIPRKPGEKTAAQAMYGDNHPSQG